MELHIDITQRDYELILEYETATKSSFRHVMRTAVANILANFTAGKLAGRIDQWHTLQETFATPVETMLQTEQTASSASNVIGTTAQPARKVTPFTSTPL